MSRVLKKIIYGSLFCIIFGTFVFFMLKPLLRTNPSCNDGIKNQAEEQVDCGGVCASCSLKSALPVLLARPPRAFSLFDDARVLFSVRNPNPNLRASFSYKLSLASVSSSVSFSDFISLKPGEERMILASRLPPLFATSSPIMASFSAFTYSFDDPTSYARLTFPGVGASLDVYERFVRFKLLNDSVIAAPRVELVAILNNKYGTPIFPLTTFIENLLPHEEREVVIAIPRDLDLSFVSTSTIELGYSIY